MVVFSRSPVLSTNALIGSRAAILGSGGGVFCERRKSAQHLHEIDCA